MREMQKEKSKIKKEFIEFLKKEILPFYDGFNWYQKMNLLCDDITPNMAKNAIYHNSLSDENFIKLVECVGRSFQAYKMKDEKFFKAAETMKWNKFFE